MYVVGILPKEQTNWEIQVLSIETWLGHLAEQCAWGGGMRSSVSVANRSRWWAGGPIFSLDESFLLARCVTEPWDTVNHNCASCYRSTKLPRTFAWSSGKSEGNMEKLYFRLEKAVISYCTCYSLAVFATSCCYSMRCLAVQFIVWKWKGLADRVSDRFV